jgi:ABC-type cobalamin transport system permease subunit
MKVALALVLLIAAVLFVVSTYTASQIAVLLLITAVGVCCAAMIAWAIDTIHSAIVDSGLFEKD